MKKRWIAMLLAVGFMLSFTSMAANSQQYKTADALNELGLFLGTDKGYELNKKLTRAEGITMLVRMIGKEREASNWTLNIPFNDVPRWAIGYVGYAAAIGITNGTSPTTFSPNSELSDYMFLTLVLRTLGYSDQGQTAAFVWNNPYALAKSVGLIDSAKVDTNFTRADAVEIFWKAMSIKLVGKNTTLAQSLIAQGVFTKAEFAAAEEIQKNGRKENAGAPILRPENSNTNTGGSLSGPGQLPGADGTDGDDDKPSHIIVPGNPNGGQNPSEEKSDLPWENGGKQPYEYTWAEYEALDDKYKDAFFEAFEDLYAFLEWQDHVQQGNTVPEPEKMPWENGGKQPSEYTWSEFQALTGDQQVAFQNTFGSADAFDAWEQEARLWADGKPWENGGKQPDAYTWREFQRLSAEQQMAFQSWFDSEEAFAGWMQDAQASVVEVPWENGGKAPSEYMWTEFEALTGAQQMAFQNWFGSTAAFEAWMQEAKSEATVNPWDNGEKPPAEYTWSEFEALTGAQQIAFQNWFGSSAAFEAWMQEAKSETTANPWDNGGKSPAEYTWAEFEALTGAQQIAFQNWFGNIEDFEEWMNRVNG